MVSRQNSKYLGKTPKHHRNLQRKSSQNFKSLLTKVEEGKDLIKTQKHRRLPTFQYSSNNSDEDFKLKSYRCEIPTEVRSFENRRVNESCEIYASDVLKSLNITDTNNGRLKEQLR